MQFKSFSKGILNLSILSVIAISPILAPVSEAAALTFTEYPVDNTVLRIRTIYAIDIDDDGDTDIMAANMIYDDIYWFRNDGSENFTKVTIDSNFVDPEFIFPVDLDEDGDKDIVVSAANSGDKIVWYDNDGSENFTERSIDSSAPGAAGITVIDMDSDGDLDVVGGIYSESYIKWYDNNGSESFTEKSVYYSNNAGFWDVDAGDMDKDNDIDIVSCKGIYNDVVWYENNGSESFTEHIIDGSHRSTDSVDIVDLDGDGEMDVVAGSRYLDGVAWYKNDGSESFTEYTIDDSLSFVDDVHTADLDGDGDNDVLVTSYDDNDVLWYENDGSERFTKRTIDSNFGSPKQITVADIDGDGDLDVAAGSVASDDLSWWEAAGDSTPPSVSTLSPTDELTGVSQTANLVIAFNENIGKTGTGTVTIKKTSNDSIVETISVTGSLVTGSGGTSITINPSVTLDENTSYYVQIHQNAFPDESGNFYAGISDTSTWNFTTVDLTDPVISSESPADEATDVSTGSSITWTTNEAASSQVQYGFTNAFGSLTTLADTSPRVTSHSVSLGDLVECSTYYYRAISVDSSENTTTGSTLQFTTTGCTNDATVETQSGSAVTTSGGGTVSVITNSSGAELTIPTSFSDNDATFQIKRLNKTTTLALISNPSGLTEVGNHIYDFRAISGATLVTSFDEDITVTMQYTDTQISSLTESSLWIYRHDGSSWNALSSCTVDQDTNTVTCSTQSFSTFGLFGSTPSSSSETSTSSVSNGGRRGSIASMQKLIDTAFEKFLKKRKGYIKDGKELEEKEEDEKENEVIEEANTNFEFVDVPSNSWFTKYVYNLANRKIIEGYATGEFKPEKTVTIAEALKMLIKAKDMQAIESHLTLNKSARNTWASPYVACIEDIDLSALGPSTNVHSPITRKEVINLASAILKEKNLKMVDRPNEYINRAEISKLISLIIE
ncbi:hypothetical protein HOF56_03020 [Candidatus Peribacteria bacterium]|nr:hypothetical protein [Candidatus Peribacteria bacterium]MBT4021543.1 hypothetical protein [Candidatus Peribacteria bacterium]MBT4240632.1 hypothetical protein [Candidatus Peribacteria bacterium]MBT4474638.1 hypothetical protein [Candidatus Peribacteria bacterium]